MLNSDSGKCYLRLTFYTLILHKPSWYKSGAIHRQVIRWAEAKEDQLRYVGASWTKEKQLRMGRAVFVVAVTAIFLIWTVEASPAAVIAEPAEETMSTEAAE